MDKEEILFLRNLLLDRRTGILERVRRLADAWREMEEHAIEMEEEAQKAVIAKPYDQLDLSGKTEIEQIDLALNRITAGDYGVCEYCGDDIDTRRLEAIPWTRLCVDCARDFEKYRMSRPGGVEPVDAATIPEAYRGMTNEQIVAAVHERLQSDERVDTEDLRIALRKNVLYLDGTVSEESEHEAILRLVTDVMGFSAIVDRIDTGEPDVEQFADGDEPGLPMCPRGSRLKWGECRVPATLSFD